MSDYSGVGENDRGGRAMKCIFCEQNNVYMDLQYVLGVKVGYAALCTDCGAMSACSDTPEQATAEWKTVTALQQNTTAAIASIRAVVAEFHSFEGDQAARKLNEVIALLEGGQ